MKKRIISALIALLICVPVIFIGGHIFYALALIIALLGLREILNLITKDDFIRFITYFIFISVIVSNLFKDTFNNIFDYKIIGIVLLLFSILMIYKKEKLNIEKGLTLLALTLFLSISFSSVIITRNISLNYFIYLLLIPIMNDTFAIIFGSLFGKNKLTNISPKKTWEGSIGGIIFGILIPSLFYLIFIKNIGLCNLLFITLILSVLGQLGDLFFSLIKRHYNIKDYSNIMPGHGGILDRMDSIIFVFLGFTYFITIL